MSNWDYRIVQHKRTSPEGKEETWYALHEVYYGDDGKPESMTDEPVSFVGECRNDVIGALRLALRDAEKRRTFVPPEEWEKRDGEAGEG